ncbi:hypothetical protein PC9H_011262 [Pleurotus ostreatus]|uniref:Uncharacterized protein n=1 Tax=Pleurotus ostreatus TaxID=5322 RepID=A0A8H6ZIE4_PLEOS|nr:uncharacterized protein PC9H_011262 [Pleurotus ostreatus]KAF7420744.1 hypothetical protein PC9H_011262 [Pleurotus ostreatus]KAJ8690135.1 hypothetical protein PTI98_011593 [Pleurotus ostreatus]
MKWLMSIGLRMGATQKKKTERTKLTKAQRQAIAKAEKDKKAIEARMKKWGQQPEAGGDEPPPLRFLDQGEALEKVVDDPNDIVPLEDYWSGLLFLGSAASNRRMWYLSTYLTSIAAARATDSTKG